MAKNKCVYRALIKMASFAWLLVLVKCGQKVKSSWDEDFWMNKLFGLISFYPVQNIDW